MKHLTRNFSQIKWKKKWRTRVGDDPTPIQNNLKALLQSQEKYPEFKMNYSNSLVYVDWSEYESFVLNSGNGPNFETVGFHIM